MLEAAEAEIERLAAVLAEHRAQVAPLAADVLAVIDGSAQRVDADMVALLRASVSSIDAAVGALHAAGREVRRAEITHSRED